MPDVELVAIMDKALKSPSSSVYKVKVENPKMGPSRTRYCGPITSIQSIWKPFVYKYNKRSDEFVSIKKGKRNDTTNPTQVYSHPSFLFFFLDKGFEEVPTQNRLSILAACEDPI